MKIINLKSENFKKIKAIDITPKDNTVIISGKNGQGKTSILDSIFAALSGKDAIPQKPIREGAKEAKIEVDLGDYVVSRTFKDEKTTLTVSNGKNQKWTSPQTMLNEIIGKLSFDPLEFANKSQKEQRQILVELTGLNLEEEDKKRDELYSKRHQVGIEGKALAQYTEEEVKEAQKHSEDYEINISKVIQELNEAEANNQQVIKLSNDLSKLADEIDSLQRVLKEKSEQFTKLKEFVDKSKVIPTDKLKETLSNAEEHNQRISKAKQVIESNDRVIEKRKEYEELTKQIEEIDETKKQLLGAAIMPIKGLSIDDDGVLFNGIPFSQLSTSEKLKVSMSIAMAMNPKLRVIRILDGSLLDEDNMQVISEMAKDSDFQVWIEKVDSSGKVGFYIEDGEIK